MFEEFPKQRPAMSPEVEAVYARHYRENREGETPATSVTRKLEEWLHRQVARDVQGPAAAGKATLELGAGTLNQLDWEPGVAPYDVVEPFAEFYEGSPKLERIRDVFADIAEVPADRRYDRVTSVATLEHVCSLPEVVARSGLLLADGGVFRASIPSEGTLLWTLGWKLTTSLEFRWKYGLDYGELMRHEHVNRAAEIERVLRYFFGELRCRVFGLSRALSFYRFYECRRPDLDRCRSYASPG